MIRVIRSIFRYSLILNDNFVRRDSAVNRLDDRIEAADFITVFFILFTLILLISLVACFIPILGEIGEKGFSEKGLGKAIIDEMSDYTFLQFIIILFIFFMNAASVVELVDNLIKRADLKRKLRFL